MGWYLSFDFRQAHAFRLSFASALSLIGTQIFCSNDSENLGKQDIKFLMVKKQILNLSQLPGGIFNFVTAGNYCGELIEWIGYAITLNGRAGWVFVSLCICMNGSQYLLIYYVRLLRTTSTYDSALVSI